MSTKAGWLGFLMNSHYTIARSVGFIPTKLVMAVMVLFCNVVVKARLPVNAMSPLCTMASGSNKLRQTLQGFMAGGIRSLKCVEP